MRVSADPSPCAHLLPLPDRQVMGKITKDGVFIEELERNPGRFLPEVSERH